MKNLMKTAQRIALFVLGTLMAMEVITLSIMKEQHLEDKGLRLPFYGIPQCSFYLF